MGGSGVGGVRGREKSGGRIVRVGGCHDPIGDFEVGHARCERAKHST